MKHIKKYEDHINFATSGFKCSHCDYIDNDITSDNYYQYKDKICPKCGNDFFSKDTYEKFDDFIWAIKTINSYSKEDLETFSETLGLKGEPISNALNFLLKLKIK